MNTKHLIAGAVLVGVGVAIYLAPPESVPEPAPAFVQDQAGFVIDRYARGCGPRLPVPEIRVDDLENRVDVADPAAWTVTVDRTRLDKARANVLNDTIPHGIAHLIRDKQTGMVSPIHDAKFNVLEAYLRGHISTCPRN